MGYKAPPLVFMPRTSKLMNVLLSFRAKLVRLSAATQSACMLLTRSASTTTRPTTSLPFTTMVSASGTLTTSRRRSSIRTSRWARSREDSNASLSPLTTLVLSWALSLVILLRSASIADSSRELDQETSSSNKELTA